MYCTKCGKQISDDSQFCCYCGARQTPIVNNTTINTSNKKTKIKIPLKNKKIIIGIIAVVLACMIFGSIVKGRSIEAINDMDAEKMIDTMSEDHVNYLINKTSGGRAEYIKEGNQYLLELKKGLLSEAGGGYSLDDISLDYEIVSVRDCTEEEIDKLNETLQEENIDPVNNVKQVTISLTLKAGTSEVKSYNDIDMQMMKVKNKWYLTYADEIGDL
jgi:hypothetical protein